MYQVYLNNFNYYHWKIFDNIIDAIQFSKKLGFEASVHYMMDDKVVEVI
jgi:hypothetical protein